MSYYCEDEDITDPGKIALKILRGIGSEDLKRLNASRMSDADKKRLDKIWELFESLAKDKSQLQSASSPLAGLQAKKKEKQGVIRKVSEHTDWCSSLAYSVKKDGSLPHMHRPPETQSSPEAMSTQSSHT